MDSSQLLGITTFTYLFASAIYIAALVFHNKRIALAGTLFTIGALLVQTAGLGLRWIESYQMGIGHAPLSNMYESVVFFAWVIVILYLGIEFKFKTRVIGAFALPLAFLAMAYASFAPIDKGINPLVPALQSNWLIAHVVTCFIGYAAFAIAAALALMYLLKSFTAGSDAVAGRFPALRTLDDIIHKCLVFGFIWLSAGIITGAVWANSAWGTYWSWDPKETWSLITWFVYAFTLHIRYTRGISGRAIAWLSLLGFLAVIFTYYGVNFLLSGLHSYA
ncbi:c-type cytochrome biogenesis protein CcsB [Desulfofustis limnaeus]|jgi:cytochrome c-type biogenesis protein CcsB|uniref:Heme exporter protein C n=1 Tax=Desulfofustis limnaeus TaxID=2740163 RepID=A0ABM7W7U7_9BACT|nr:c-type cytochrome biogenesis protein CcsB [Desulfofustis limnaeus]MDX9896609.1 c-type cytochrome biogenesis protein CcsB [Desulfofustis sp.]BDD86934.1 c-type cytochrome biogenesis protein CcsB [Desulfofustis limnaeus]